MKKLEAPAHYVCPICHARLDQCDQTTPGKKMTPRPGDYGVCGECGTFMMFKQHGLLLEAVQVLQADIPKQILPWMMELRETAVEQCFSE